MAFPVAVAGLEARRMHTVTQVKFGILLLGALQSGRPTS